MGAWQSFGHLTATSRGIIKKETLMLIIEAFVAGSYWFYRTFLECADGWDDVVYDACVHPGGRP